MAKRPNAPKKALYQNSCVECNRIFVLSLLVQNPGAAAPKETRTEPAPGVVTRAHSRPCRQIAAVTAAALPEEILVWEIFVRLPANDILRCRAVCSYWRGITSAPDFLLAHHHRQPSLLLLTCYNTSNTDPIFQRGHPVLGFDDYNSFRIHASCDGLLLLSLSDGSFSICNAATRQCDPLPCLAATGRHINTAALYLHGPSGEYRVLYWKWRHLKEAVYYILAMRRRGRSPRCIGVPSDTPGIKKAMLAWNGRTTSPVVFRNCLYWEPRCSDADIFGFDMVAESFRLMHGPADATRSCTRLCDMEGSIGFSCFGEGMTDAKIWVLEDYEREVWSLKYHVKFPAGSLCNREDMQHLVLSNKGDVLVYSPSKGYMFHCDNTGKLLEEFRCDSSNMILIGPRVKQSLVKHDFSLRRGCARDGQLRFFERL